MCALDVIKSQHKAAVSHSSVVVESRGLLLCGQGVLVVSVFELVEFLFDLATFLVEPPGIARTLLLGGGRKFGEVVLHILDAQFGLGFRFRQFRLNFFQ